MKNGLSDLNNILFEQLERLADDDLDLEKEAKKAEALCGVADQILQVGRLQIDALKMAKQYNYQAADLPALIAPKDSKKAIEAAHV